jgi:FkbM family methyltransferase
MENYTKFINTYSFDVLNNIDCDKFERILDVFSNKFNINEKTIFFDVGCHAGSFVRTLLRKFNSQCIHCFEPHPILSKMTKSTYPSVVMNDVCIGNKNGDIDIFIPELSVAISSTINRPVFSTLNQKINVYNTRSITLDSYCNLNSIEQIDFIKIDVEGGEKSVFEGAMNLLSTKKIKAGMFEVGDTLTDAGTSTEDVCRLIESYGYKIEKIFVNDYFFYA